MKTLLQISLSLFLIALYGCKQEAKTDTADAKRLTIRIRTDPKGAKVFLDGSKLEAVTPCQVETDNHGHMVEIRYPGYETVWHRVPPVVDITKPYDALSEVELKPKTVPLILDTAPRGALVSIDGQDRGTTPVYIKEVRLGQHKVNFKFKAGYAPVNINVDVREGEPQIIKQSMESILGQVKVVSRDANAQIYIDGAFKGRIGASGEALDVKELEEGNHLLVAKKPGYKDLEHKFVLKRQQRKLVQLPAMEQLPGTIVITSDPANAVVTRNQQQIGKTPLTLEDLRDKSITFKVELDGHDPALKTVKVVPGMKKTVSVKLTRNVGSITLISQPPGCIIFVDGKKVGATLPSDAPNISKLFEYTGLRPGPHVIRVEKSGYVPRQKQIIVQKGANVDLKTVKLKEKWLPTHLLKTRRATKVLRVRLLGRTKDGFQVEYYKGTSRIVYNVKASELEIWKRIE